MDLSQLVKIARGDEPADVYFRNAKVINVFTGEVIETGVAIAGKLIVGLGEYDARETIDLEGRYIAPGLIDSHVHIESAMVTPPEFARAVLARGTTTVVTDPHEIGNVLGLVGIRYMIDRAKNLPLSVFVNASSCIPSTHMETTGAALEWEDLETLLEEETLLGLAEVMNFPGVVAGDPGMLNKIRGFQGRVLDGHCPGLSGNALNAYISAGIGSDHECTTVEEALEKLRLGMVILIREATNAQDLRPLLPLVTPETAHRICFCTDDRQPADLLEDGGIDYMIRTAIAEGVPPVRAFQLATLNPARYFRLHDRGAVAPGLRADLVTFSDLGAPRAEMVFSAGKLVARNGEVLLFENPGVGPPLPGSMNVAWDRVDFHIPKAGEQVRIIGSKPNQLITEHIVEETPHEGGQVVTDTGRDILKIAVVERHKGTGRVGKGLVRGIGLQRGALATTIAHDHHNIVVVGVDDRSMLAAARAVVETQGGMAAVDGESVLAQLPLPIAGLMSDKPIQQVGDGMAAMLRAANRLGSSLHDPFMAMSFMALPVIPSLKITDHGLVDVDRFEVVPLFV